MVSKLHYYQTTLEWTGNLGEGTTAYTRYERNFTAHSVGKPDILGSADPAFRGDKTRWNPEDLLLTSISACHKLWYLHLCAVNQIVVTQYLDYAEAVMDEGNEQQAGRFISAILRPKVIISKQSDLIRAKELHHEAHRLCFIANSLNFPIECEPEITHEIA